MARLKRSSQALDKAERRIAGIKSIGDAVVLGKGLSVQNYAAAIELVRQRLEAYNSALSTVDAAALLHNYSVFRPKALLRRLFSIRLSN
jgi:hypothetical protein